MCSRWDSRETNTAKRRHESDIGERMLGGTHKNRLYRSLRAMAV